MTSVYVTNNWRSDFVYDGEMRRRIERDYAWQSNAWVETNEVHFIYDGNVVIQERDINNLPKVTYTRGNDLSGSLQGAGGIGGLLARTDNSQLIIGSPSAHTFYHADGNGNITAMINGSQAIVAKYLYDPFGNTLSLSGSLASANTYRFSSKEWNDNAGLYYYLYRFYDPNLQRWPNRDPLGELGFETLKHQQRFVPELQSKLFRNSINELDGGNLYDFVRNQPTLFKDLNGLFAFDCDYVSQRISDLQTLSDFGALLPGEDEELMSLKAYYSQNCQDHQPPLPPASTPCPVKLPAPTPNPNQNNRNTTPPVPPIFIIPWYIEWLPVELAPLGA